MENHLLNYSIVCSTDRLPEYLNNGLKEASKMSPYLNLNVVRWGIKVSDWVYSPPEIAG